MDSGFFSESVVQLLDPLLRQSRVPPGGDEASHPFRDLNNLMFRDIEQTERLHLVMGLLVAVHPFTEMGLDVFHIAGQLLRNLAT